MIEKGANNWNRSLNDVFKEEIIKFIGSILFPALFLHEDFCLRTFSAILRASILLIAILFLLFVVTNVSFDLLETTLSISC